MLSADQAREISKNALLQIEKTSLLYHLKVIEVKIEKISANGETATFFDRSELPKLNVLKQVITEKLTALGYTVHYAKGILYIGWKQ